MELFQKDILKDQVIIITGGGAVAWGDPWDCVLPSWGPQSS